MIHDFTVICSASSNSKLLDSLNTLGYVCNETSTQLHDVHVAKPAQWGIVHVLRLATLILLHCENEHESEHKTVCLGNVNISPRIVQYLIITCIEMNQNLSVGIQCKSLSVQLICPKAKLMRRRTCVFREHGKRKPNKVRRLRLIAFVKIYFSYQAAFLCLTHGRLAKTGMI